MTDEIRKLHEAMGIEYPLPDLDGPLVRAKMVIHDRQGKPLAACALKTFAEAFLWLNLEASPRERIVAIRRLSATMTGTAKGSGLEEVSCWVPPEIEPQFAHMLTELGWIKSPWPNWTKIL